MLRTTYVLLSIVVATTVGATEFDVQIGAFQKPDVADVNVPADIGPLRTTLSRDGLTRFLVGPFANRAEANRARDALRRLGHTGAFIRATGQESSSATRGTAARAFETRRGARQDAAGMPSQRDIDLLSSLSEEERRNVVYLDGRLHRKVGDEFIPLRN